MKDLKLLSPGGLGVKPHDHIVFIDTEHGAALASTDQNHTHEIIYTPETPEVPPTEESQDPETGETIPANPGSPAIPESWDVSPAEDGHTHEIMMESELPRKTKQRKPDDSEILSDVMTYFSSAIETEGESLEDAIESDGFYDGSGQWTEKEKQYLIERDRACLTINETAKECNKLSGHQRQTRTDFKCVPVGGTDQTVCDALNIVIKNVTEQCFYEREEAKAFLDCVITGRGLFNLYIDKSKNPQGDIIIERFPYGDCKMGEHEKEDLSDLEFLLKDKMYSLGRLKATHEDLEEELTADFDRFLNMQPTIVSEDRSKDAYLQPNNERPVSLLNGTIKMVDVERKEMRVIELWRKKYVKVPVLVNVEADYYGDGFGLSTKTIKRIKSIPGFFSVERVVPKIVLSRTCGGLILEYQDPAELPVDDFFIVPIYCNKRGNKFWGKVKDIKDPQREINKRHSQAVDIGNKAAGSGWIYDAETFPTTADADNFSKNSSSPGFTAKVSDVLRPPVQITSGEVPNITVELLDLAHKHLSELMNITVNPNGANESNAMFTYRQKLLFAGNEYLFDNLKFAKVKLGRLLINIIQDIYTPERIFRIIQDEDARNPKGAMIGGIPASEFSEEDIKKLLTENDLTKIDVIVTEGVYSPSVRMAIFAVLTDLKTAGADVPLELLFEFADIPHEVKEQVLSVIQQSADAESQEQKQKSMTELWKTAMGKGMLPPEAMSKLNEMLGVDLTGGANGAPPQNNSGAITQ